LHFCCIENIKLNVSGLKFPIQVILLSVLNKWIVGFKLVLARFNTVVLLMFRLMEKFSELKEYMLSMETWALENRYRE